MYNKFADDETSTVTDRAVKIQQAKTRTQAAKSFVAWLDDKTTPPFVQTYNQKIKAKIGSSVITAIQGGNVDAKATEALLDACKVHTGLTRDDWAKVDRKDIVAALKLLGNLVVFGKMAALGNTTGLDAVVDSLDNILPKYFNLAGLLVETNSNSTLIERVKGHADGKGKRNQLLKADFLIKAISKVGKGFQAHSKLEHAQMKGLLHTIVSEAKNPSGATAILDALAAFTLVGDEEADLAKANSAISNLVITTGSNADAGTASGNIARVMTAIAAVKGGSLTKGQKINQIAEILDTNQDLPEITKEAIRVHYIAEDLGYDYQSKIGAGLLLNEEQESAMLSTNPITYISAGAGSGKTRVLSGRVLNLLKRGSGNTPFNIIAVSFTKKSALELRSRVKKGKNLAEIASGDLDDIDNTLIGRTIHSVAYEMCSLFNPKVLHEKKIIEEYEQYLMYEKAIAEIKKGVTNSSWWDGAPVEPPFIQSQAYRNLSPDAKLKGLLALNLYNVANYVLNVKKARNTTWALDNIAVFGPLVTRGTILTPTDPAWTTPVRLQSGNTMTPLGLLYFELEQERGKKILKRFDYTFDPRSKTITDNSNSLRTASSTDDATVWYQIGATEDAIKSSGLTARSLSLYITKAKSEYLKPKDCIDREKVNSEEGVTLFPAAYAAYEALLKGEDKADFDDAMIAGVQALSDPEALKKARSRFKHILVDEAQDLNTVQRDFFGLIIGTHEPKEEGGVVKGQDSPAQGKSITFIGDPKQTIYGFRGATDAAFVQGANNAKGAEGQGLYNLEMNFRSGRKIVDAANRLITAELGDTQAAAVGGVCAVPLDKEDGQIGHHTFTDVKAASSDFAEFIAAQKSANNTLGSSLVYNDFGLACRTNAEVVPYALALFEKGIPFRSGVDPFKHPASSAVLSVMNLLSTDPTENFKAVKATLRLLGHNDVVQGNHLYEAYVAVKGSSNQTILEYFTKTKKGPALAPQTISERLMEKFPRLDQNKLNEAFQALAQIVDGVKTASSAAEFINKIMGLVPYADGKILTADGGQTLYAIYNQKVTKDAEAEAASAAASDVSADESGGGEGEATSTSDGNDGVEEDALNGVYSNPLDVLLKMVRSITVQRPENLPKKIQDFLKRVAEVRKDAKKPLSEFSERDLKNKVTLDTVHGWKGLECKYLYVPMTSKWPSSKITKANTLLAPVDANENANARKARLQQINRQEEARLAYVAVTRGKSEVKVISYTGAKKVKAKGQETEVKLGQSPFINLMGICTTDGGVNTPVASTARNASYEGLTAADWSEMENLGVFVDEV